MPIEVELKFRVPDRGALERQLAELGFELQEAVLQVDCYFAHPSRDFAQTDEALRLRRVGEFNYITYKGPKLDATTKTRRELEIELAAAERSAQDARELLGALGFTPVLEVRKHRVHNTLRWQGREITVSLDDVAGLGNFVELEILASESEADPARRCIESLSSRLGLSNTERRSYLELLLEKAP